MIAGFNMSAKTQQALKDVLAQLNAQQQGKAFDALVNLCLEVHAFARQETIEELRKQWSEALRTMASVLGKS